MKLPSHFIIHGYYRGKLDDLTFLGNEEFPRVPDHVFGLLLASEDDPHASYLLHDAVVSLQYCVLERIFQCLCIIFDPADALALTKYHARIIILTLIEVLLNLLLIVIENAKKDSFASLTELHSYVAHLFILVAIPLLQEDSFLAIEDLGFSNYRLCILQVVVIVLLLVNNVTI